MDASVVSRRVALDILVSCLDRGQPLDDALARHQGFAGLDPRDRAFVRLLLATTLRRLGEIEEVLGFLIERPLDGANAAGRQVLRLGAAQLLFLGTPPHAAVDTSVRLVVDAGLPHLKGLANAVLRRISRDGPALLGDRDPARLNTPQWLWDSWTESYGEQATRAIAAAHLIEAPLDLTTRSNTDFWAGRLEGEVLPTGTIRREGGGIVTELPGFAEGAWWVQDAAATLPARLLGDIAGKRVADLCAAPGGKTAQLARAGAAVTAVDISANRLQRVRENLARLRLDARLVAADILDWRPEQAFDAILLDAPCTATGTIRRHPEIAWIKRPSDIAPLADLQARMLDRAFSLLKPGGRLVFCTCSLEPEEGERQAEALLARRPDVRLDPVRPHEVAGLAHLIDGGGRLRTLPSSGFGEDRVAPERGAPRGMDGFFAARFVRSPAD
jgi:16S rRNA (cytosine967-C5)-methyltransferase